VAAKFIESLNPSGQQDFRKYCSPSCKNSTFCAPVAAEAISKIIHTLPNNKSQGEDNINTKLLKEISEYVTTPLTNLTNLSFETGAIPTELKIAKVFPIYKRGTAREVHGNAVQGAKSAVYDV